MRVASPPIRHPCYYGIDFPRRTDLIANQRTVDEIRDFLAVDSLAYLSLEAMLGCVDAQRKNYCNACFSGDYPIPIDGDFHKEIFERNQLTFFDARGPLAAASTHGDGRSNTPGANGNNP
jgi:amidophosphoribosyltransferase